MWKRSKAHQRPDVSGFTDGRVLLSKQDTYRPAKFYWSYFSLDPQIVRCDMSSSERLGIPHQRWEIGRDVLRLMVEDLTLPSLMQGNLSGKVESQPQATDELVITLGDKGQTTEIRVPNAGVKYFLNVTYLSVGRSDAQERTNAAIASGFEALCAQYSDLPKD